MTEEAKYLRKVQTAVTCFVRCGDEFLFLKRGEHKRIDPGKLNGIGGRVEPGENFLDAVVRETEEESGYRVSLADTRLAAVVRFEGGYEEDWIMCYFVMDVADKDIPGGNAEEDGELLWLHKDTVLTSGYDLVDELKYCFKEIAQGGELLFMNCRIDSDEKVEHMTLSRL